MHHSLMLDSIDNTSWELCCLPHCLYKARVPLGPCRNHRYLQSTKLGQAELLPCAAGEDYNVEHSGDGPRPFSAVLDTGLHRTSTGSKVFACLKVSHH